MNYKKYSAAVIAAISIFALSSCSNPKSSVEYKALEAEVDSLKSQIETVEESIAKSAENNALIDSVQAELEERRAEFAYVVSGLAIRKDIISVLGKEACAKYVKALQQYVSVSDDYSGGFRAEVDKLSGRPGNAILGNDDFTIEDEVPQSVVDYSVELKKTRCSYDAQNEFYKQCETVDKKLINKNPESFKGKCIKGTVRISQFDSNTGPCAFQGYLGGGYDVRAQFGQTLDPNNHNEEKDCEWTEKLVEDNFLTFWGWGLGAYTYTTSNGGSQTIPAFKMVMYQKG
jgi:hypothetical protein